MAQPANIIPPAPPAARGYSRWLTGLWLVAALGIAGVMMMLNTPTKSPVEDTIAWQHVEKRATLEVNSTGKPTLLFFTADWCLPCKLLKQKTLTDTKIAETIGSSFVPMKIDLTDQKSPQQLLARDWKIDGLPTLVVVSPDGKEVDRAIGFLSAQELARWLDKTRQSTAAAPTTQVRETSSEPLRH